MGRLYQKTVCGEKTLAYFESDRVRSGNGTADIIASYNSMGQIFGRMLNHSSNIIASCDNNGNIRKGNGAYGWVLAKCEDGIIFEGSGAGGRVLAYFDGDMYGAAAVAAVLLIQ